MGVKHPAMAGAPDDKLTENLSLAGLFLFVDELLCSVERCLKFWKAKGAGDNDRREPGSIGLQRVPSAVRLLQLGFERCVLRSSLFVLLDAVEAFFELGDERSFSRLETVATHDAPEIIATRPVRIVDGHQIFGRAACYQDDDVGFGGLVHERQFAPLLNGVLY